MSERQAGNIRIDEVGPGVWMGTAMDTRGRVIMRGWHSHRLACGHRRSTKKGWPALTCDCGICADRSEPA